MPATKLLPTGFLGTRADVLMDVTIVLFTVLPLAMLGAFWLVRRGRPRAHRNMQLGMLALVIPALILLEVDIRLSGGSVAFVSQGSLSPAFMRWFLLFHIAIAVATFVSWLRLAIISFRRFGVSLPGPFGARHRRWGKVTFWGVCMTSGTGCALYVLLFMS